MQFIYRTGNKIRTSLRPFFMRSLLVHLVLLLGFSGVVPSCQKDIKKPPSISVNLVSIPAAKKDEKKEIITAAAKPEQIKKKKEVQEKKEPVKKPPKKLKKITEKVKNTEKKPQPVKPEAAPKKDAPKVVSKKPEKVKEVKKEEIVEKAEKVEKAEDKQKGQKSLLKDLDTQKAELDEIFENVTEEQVKQPIVEPITNKDSSTDKAQEIKVDANYIMEIANIVKSQVKNCWIIPIGAKNIENISVSLIIRFNKDGKVLSVEPEDKRRYAMDDNYRVLADSGVWAVKECSPFVGLPQDTYELWQESSFTFIPRHSL